MPTPRTRSPSWKPRSAETLRALARMPQPFPHNTEPRTMFFPIGPLDAMPIRAPADTQAANDPQYVAAEPSAT